MLRRYLSFISGIFLVFPMIDNAFADGDAVAHPVLVNAAQIQALRQDTAKRMKLQQRCDSELPLQASPVADYAPGPHYAAAGTQALASATQSLSDDSRVAYRAAPCFLLTSDQRYAKHVQAMLDAWGNTLHSVSNGQGEAEMNFNMPQFVIAASWVRGANDWDDSRFKTMLTTIVAPLSRAKMPNNHGNWGVFLDVTIAAYLNNERLLHAAAARWQTLIEFQVAGDGSLPLEICRSATSSWCAGPDRGINGLNYTHYTLLPATMAAQVLLSQGVDVYRSAAGRKLGQAYARAASWTLQPETFPYYASNRGVLHGSRNAAYFAVLQRHYANADATAVLTQGNLGMNFNELLMLFQ